VLIVLLVILTLIGLPFEITLWDWLKLLAVPITVGGAVPLLNKLQKDCELDVQKRQAQDEALQTYLGEMGHLLLEKGLRNSHEHGEGAYIDKSDSLENDNVRILARARTLTVVRTLDPDQKRSVLDFLYESELIKRITPKQPTEPDERPWWRRMFGEQSKRVVSTSTQEPKAIVDLGGIDRFGGAADLSGANLEFDHLALANLHGATLTSANLREANLRESYLEKCDLRGADLQAADLQAADLQAADLRGANLRKAKLSGAYLVNADLSGAILINISIEAAPTANLGGADLSGADLSGAKGVTVQKLGMCKSLAGATMPNGQKYEDWLEDKKVINCDPDWSIPLDVKKLKYKEGRGEDGENSGPS
jgi:hypothetical protein